MAPNVNLKNILLKILFLIGFVGHQGSMFYAAVEQPPIVLGFSQRVAVETLFRYCAMEKNPFYVEREKKRLQQEKRIKKILEKKGEDLTPFQQIELLKHTFDLSFADKLVAKTLKAFIVSWVCLAALELWWRGYCRQQFRAQKKQEDREKDKWVTYEEDFEIKLKGRFGQEDSGEEHPKSSKFRVNPSPKSGDLPESPSPESPASGGTSSKSSMDENPWLYEAKIAFSPFRKKLVDMHYALNKWYAQSQGRIVKPGPVYDFEIVGEPISSTNLPKSVVEGQCADLLETLGVDLSEREPDFFVEELPKTEKEACGRDVGFDDDLGTEAQDVPTDGYCSGKIPVKDPGARPSRKPTRIPIPKRSSSSRPPSSSTDRAFYDDLLGRKKTVPKFPFTVCSRYSYKPKSEFKLRWGGELTWLENFLHYGVRLYPLASVAWRFAMNLVRGGSQTPEVFLESLFKNFSSEYVAGFGGSDHKKYLLAVLIKPLWKKHAGNQEKICTELAQMGEKMRGLETRLSSGSGRNKQKALYSLVMGVHGGVLPFEHVHFMGRINLAFEQGIVHRVLKAGIVTAGLVFAQAIVRAFVTKNVWNNFGHKDFYVQPIFSGLFTYWTIKACIDKAWNYDSSQARNDYEIFLTRLGLTKQELYSESFYWAWFFPMWRANKRDVLEVEACFMNRVDEVKKVFDAPLKA